jgi:hypothetical protein
MPLSAGCAVVALVFLCMCPFHFCRGYGGRRDGLGEREWSPVVEQRPDPALQRLQVKQLLSEVAESGCVSRIPFDRGECLP